jgi:poly-gamma-glutamate synthesis protein (capsule biosynthesis protein)
MAANGRKWNQPITAGLDQSVHRTMTHKLTLRAPTRVTILRRTLTTFILVPVMAAGFSLIIAAEPIPAGLISQSNEVTPTPSILSPSQPGLVTLALLGDVNLGRGVHPHTKTFNYIEPYLQSADLAMANLESPLTKGNVITKSPYPLCAPPERTHFLSDVGFDLLSIANNHRFDCGMYGYLGTKTYLHDNGMEAIPAGLIPIKREINGVKMTFLAIDATSKVNTDDLLNAIRTASQDGSVVIVSIHWGYEYQVEPTQYQRTLAKQMAEAGAALIWGHHPHVLQPTEWIEIPCNVQNPVQICRKTLVLYSLGNALFDQYGLPDTRQSALIMVKVNKDGVQEMLPIPFVIDVSHSRLIAADEETTKKIFEKLQPK